MTSSTSASRVALVALALLGAGGLLLPWLAERGRSETSATIALRLEEPAELLVLGGSVAEVGVDAGRLPEARNLAFFGTQPAHWLAIWRHHVLAKGRAPARLLLYAPLGTLLHGRLVAESERSELISLLPWADPQLEELALGAPIGHADRFHRLRREVRDGLLETITEAPESVGVPMPQQAPVGPNPTGTGKPPWKATPELMVPDQSLVAMLIDEATAAGTRVVVVIPAVRGGNQAYPTDPTVLAWLRTAPVDIVDLSCLPIPDAEFHSTHHLRERGRDQVTAVLAGILAGLPVGPADAPGTFTGCPG